MTHNTDPIGYLNQAPMRLQQFIVVGIAVILTALDGFDLLSISFAAPGILMEWNISRGALGIVLSMELIGMGIGSLLMGALADSKGRRPTVMLCLILMALGMYLSVYANSVLELSICRVITGVGIGGMLATTNALTAEVSGARYRKVCISFMVVGFAFGGIFGGMVSSSLLEESGWRSIFMLGAIVTLCVLPFIYFFVPESIPWLARKRPESALDKINRSLKTLGHQVIIHELIVKNETNTEGSFTDVFKKGLRTQTILVSAVYVFHTVTFYFVLKWIPAIVAQMGFSPSLSATVLVWASVGGLIGALLFGFIALKINLKILLVSSLAMSSVAIVLFGHTPARIDQFSFYAALAGFFCQSSVAGMYAAMAVVFPANTRAFGTGFALGIGRGGAILSPIIVGVLLSQNYTLPQVSIIMAVGSGVAAIASLFLKLNVGSEARAITR